MTNPLVELVNGIVPYARHSHVEVIDVGDGTSVATMTDVPELRNHVDSLHAGALFTLAETASGAAMLGTFSNYLATATPLAAEASVKYRRIARGVITARATLTRAGDELRDEFERNGVVRFAATVELTDERDRCVASASVDWHVKLN